MPLSQTALPTPQFLEDKALMRGILDIPDPENQEWGFLRNFGVLVESSIETPSGVVDFLQRLRELRSEPRPSVQAISAIYEDLEQMKAMEGHNIR